MMKASMIAVFLLLSSGAVMSGDKATRSAAQFPDGEVNAYITALQEDMRAADNLISQIQQTSGPNTFHEDGVRRSAYLAEQAVSIVHARAQQLERADGLTDNERANVRKAVNRLTDASASIARLQSSMEIAPIVFRRQDERNIRNETIVLRAQLADAQDAISEVSNGYRVAERQRVVP